jgi:hypothetical protein
MYTQFDCGIVTKHLVSCVTKIRIAQNRRGTKFVSHASSSTVRNTQYEHKKTNMSNNQPCTNGRHQCVLGGIAPGTHKCPQCRRHIHALCGVEVAVAAGTSAMNNRMCFDCQQPISTAAAARATTTTAPATTTTAQQG